MRWKSHVWCGAGEKLEIISKAYLSLYPGIPGISGFDLAEKFREHYNNLGGAFIAGSVIDFSLEDKIKKITLDNEKVYYAKSVIIAAGADYRKLGIKGEKKLTGSGVSYCATCDGAFFRNKVTAVVGGGDVAIEDAIFLARICKKVYVIHRREEFRAAKILSSKLLSMENVEILWNSVVEKINGDNVVESIEIKNLKKDSLTTIEVSGIFIAVGMLPNSDVYKKVVNTDNNGYIVADESCETNIPGIYAAGDIRTKALKQVITAAADGANAITSVERYLNELS